jgi:hypothetical protein
MWFWEPTESATPATASKRQRRFASLSPSMAMAPLPSSLITQVSSPTSEDIRWVQCG